MRTSMQTAQRPWTGLGIRVADDPGEDINCNLPGMVAAELAKLGGRAPVSVLLFRLGGYVHDGGADWLLLDAIADAPDAFEFYSV